jgi:hypothetical protein
MAVAAVSCGTEAVQVSPTTRSAAVDPAFDPCTLPDDALRGAGVDPATEESGVFGLDYPSANVCGWTGKGFLLSVFQVGKPIGDVKSNPRNMEFVSAPVGSRDAFTYREAGYASDEYCDVAFGNTEGSVLIRVEQQTSRPNPVADPCGVAVRTANTLDDSIPR